MPEQGRFSEAAGFEAEAIRLAESTRRAFPIGVVHRAAGILSLLKGEWAKAHALVEHGLAAGRAGNVVLILPFAVASPARALARLGKAGEALSRLKEGEELLDRHAELGIVGDCGWAYHALGRASLQLGRCAEAERLGNRALQLSPSHPGFRAHALLLLGDVAMHPDSLQPARAEAHYRQALELAQARRMRPVVGHCHVGLGTLCVRTEKREPAQQHLATATTMFREMGMTYWLENTETELK